MTSDDKDFQKIFEFIVKNKSNTMSWQNGAIRNFIRWALYFRKLFIVWAPAGAGQRIAALAVGWRTESIGPQNQPLTFENTEFGDNLYIYQVIVHPDFKHAGTLFQLLSLGLWRYPGVERAFWFSEHHQSKRLVQVPINRLLKQLAHQVAPKRLTKYIRRSAWAAEDNQASQMLAPLR